MANHIPKEQCENRALYRIRSRNLAFGVYDAGRGGFIGLRTKFDDTYLFTEFHWDNGPPHGTVHPIERLEETLPPEIPLEERGPTVCQTCGKPTAFRFDAVNEKGMEVGKHYHIDAPDTFCGKGWAHSTANKALHQWMEQIEAKYLAKRRAVLARAEEVFGDAEKARHWLTQPNMALDNKIPIMLLEESDDGAQRVDDVLARIDHGVYT